MRNEESLINNKMLHFVQHDNTTFKKSRRIFLLLFLFSVGVFAQTPAKEKPIKISVGIFTSPKISRVLIAPESEVYSVFAGDSLVILLNRNDVLSVMAQNDSLLLKNISKTLGVYKKIKITPLADGSTLKIKPMDNKTELIFDDDILISASKTSLKMINEVDIDNYVAGVVQEETGSSAPKEYYKVQAIMCRTFVIETKGKHSDDGYDICDREHCQVFKGRKDKNPEIKLAVAATHGTVLVDQNNELIFAAYHSNCGGQTDYSENVWKTGKDYLKPVVDSFCVNSRNARWEKIMSIQDWEKYLVKQNKNYSKPADSLYHFYQPKRKTNYELYGVKIPLTQLRKDLKLSSTFFDLKQEGDKIIINGRGSGHGVGMCQQGAMEMASQGHNYKKILAYYYKGVKLINYSQVKQD